MCCGDCSGSVFVVMVILLLACEISSLRPALPSLSPLSAVPSSNPFVSVYMPNFAVIPRPPCVASEELNREQTAKMDLQVTWQRANESFMEVQAALTNHCQELEDRLVAFRFSESPTGSMQVCVPEEGADTARMKSIVSTLFQGNAHVFIGLAPPVPGQNSKRNANQQTSNAQHGQ